MRKTFKELTSNMDMVLFNNIVKIDYHLELELWIDYYLYNELYLKDEFDTLKENWDIEENTNFNDKSDEYKDIYQYFAISRINWEYLSKITWMPLYYSWVCDIFILWVDFFDNWENISYEI